MENARISARGDLIHRPRSLLSSRHTPLLAVTRMDCGPGRLFSKLRAPTRGAPVDRPARAMTLRRSRRPPAGGGPSSNDRRQYRLGLALVGDRKGIARCGGAGKMAREKVLHAKAMGDRGRDYALGVGKGNPDYYQTSLKTISADQARRLLVNSVRTSAIVGA